MEKTIEYSITKEHCQSMIDKYGNVCDSCGGELEPIETVDNGGNPTYWAGCLKCQKFTWGRTKEVFETARDMVVNQGYVAYTHMKKDDYQYIESQISGTCYLVSQVLDTYKLIQAK